jgi:NAD(P)-dependent dehydrogenase (short-subunit alcohol dehydrogenase family)
MKRLEGRVALVTGAASGTGRVTAVRLADEA